MTTPPPGLAAEQAVVDVLYARLDALRGEAAERLAAVRREGPSGSPQNRSERDAFATLYEDRIAQLDAVEDRLCFGRLDLVGGDRLYVGRVGLSDADHAPLLTDWRAPAARAFYSATAASPSGVVSRRHITTRARQVTAVEDDVLDVEALRSSGGEAALAGEGALLAALSRRRSDRMTDIVATIQAEQDAVIRAPMEGALVVQGGPGTGKTAVALHRAAFLLYHHREALERSGVLLIGPSARFLRYIEHVLPSLGETGAVTTTLAGLVRETAVTAVEEDAVAAIKGRAEMAAVVAAAVRERQRVPRRDQEIRLDGHTAVIRRADIREAQARARRDRSSHNAARAPFVKEMLRRLSSQIAAQLGEGVVEEDRREIERDLREMPEVRVALNLAWMPMTPERLLGDLFSRAHLLDHAAPGLTPAERALLLRPADSPWTDADVPLLDEAAELLGPLPGGPARDEGPSAEEVAYAREVLGTFGGGGMVSAEMLARRMAGGTSRMTVAERAAQDRSWTFGHVVVDEAQELSPMAWRMLLRRCPTRSFTIVGDVAQTASAAGARWWPDMLDPVFGQHWAQRELTVSYRIPAAVAEAAQSYARAAGLPVTALTAARATDDAVRGHRASGDALPGLAAEVAWGRQGALDASGGGTCAVIAPPGLVEGLRAAVLSLAPEGGSDGGGAAEVAVLTAREAKGLEYDAVVVVEPALIGERPGDLYVALTRPTATLDLVHAEPLPRGLG